MSGRVRFNHGAREIPFRATWPESDVMIVLDGIAPEATGHADVELVSDTMVQPAQLDPASSDKRQLGFGVVGIGFAAAAA